MIFGKPCAGCEAREAEIRRLNDRCTRYEEQLDRAMKRFLELADPRANARVAQADRLAAQPVTTAPRPAAPEAPLLPGTEPAPPYDEPAWEVDAES